MEDKAMETLVAPQNRPISKLIAPEGGCGKQNDDLRASLARASRRLLTLMVTLGRLCLRRRSLKTGRCVLRVQRFGCLFVIFR